MEENKEAVGTTPEEVKDLSARANMDGLPDFGFDARLAEKVFSFIDFIKACVFCGVFCIAVDLVTALGAYNVAILLAPPVHVIPSLRHSDSLQSALEPTDPSSCELLDAASYPPSAAFSANFDKTICSDLFRFASLNISYGGIWSIWATVIALLVAILVFKNTLNRMFEAHLTRAEQYVAEVNGVTADRGLSAFLDLDEVVEEGAAEPGATAISKGQIEQFLGLIKSYQYWRVGLLLIQLLGLIWMITLSNIFVGSELADSLMRNQSVKDFAPPEDSLNGIRVAFELIEQGMHPRYLTLHMVGCLMLAYVVAEFALPLSPTSIAGMGRIAHLADMSRLTRLKRAVASLETSSFSNLERRMAVTSIAILGSVMFRLALWVAGVSGTFRQEVLLFACCLLWVVVNQWIGRRIANRFRWVEPDLGLPSYWRVMRDSLLWVFSAALILAAVLDLANNPARSVLVVSSVSVIAVGVRSFAGRKTRGGRWLYRGWGIRSIVSKYDRKRLDGLKAEITSLEGRVG